MDYSCARDSGNLTDDFANPLTTYIRATTVTESGKNVFNTQVGYVMAYTGFKTIWEKVVYFTESSKYPCVYWNWSILSVESET